MPVTLSSNLKKEQRKVLLQTAMGVVGLVVIVVMTIVSINYLALRK